VLRSPQAVSGYWLLLRPRPKHRKQTTLAMDFGMENEKLRLGRGAQVLASQHLGLGNRALLVGRGGAWGQRINILQLSYAYELMRILGLRSELRGLEAFTHVRYAGRE
jgi:hypothetical protein